MAKGATYVVQYRRKRNRQTDYKTRLNLLKSGKPRLVIRPSNRHIIAQVVDYREDGDIVLASAHSSELKNFGWDFSMSNVPAAYLTGMLCGLRASSSGVKDMILDLGLYPSIHGSRLYAALKGAIDAELSIPCREGIFPDADRISGKHIADYGGKDIPKKFDKIKKSILKSFK